MIVTGAGVTMAINGAVSREAMTLTDKWGRNPIAVSAFSPLWWILLVTCTFGFCYCAYLLVHLVRRQY